MGRGCVFVEHPKETQEHLPAVQEALRHDVWCPHRRERWGEESLGRVDQNTMEYFELDKLAPKSYKRVMEETKEIGNKISDTFGRFVPHDKEVKIFYKGEKESFKGVEDNKMPVEIEKERPAFFSKNLLMKAKTPESGSNTTVRPSGLS